MSDELLFKIERHLARLVEIFERDPAEDEEYFDDDVPPPPLKVVRPAMWKKGTDNANH